MHPTPAVSVVLPAKDEAGNIEDCLSSLTTQAASADEIIVLDNGSTDETGEIAREYDRVRVIDAPDSRFEDAHYRGLAQLRQFGAEQARNEVVATTDADTVPPDGWLNRIKTHFADDDDLSVLWGVVTDTNGVPMRNLTGKYLTFLGGVSGANTAFRKADFEDLDKGYVGWPIFEDVALITRLARTGKAVHDTSLEMRSDLDRRRYQTLPMVGVGAAGIAAGTLLGGKSGTLVGGAGVGLAGTELFYEQIAEMRRGVRQTLGVDVQDTPIHHDQVGLACILAGVVIGGQPGVGAIGIGSGILGHHLLTEGASALPSELMHNTDEVCRIEDDGALSVVCEPAEETSAKWTRVLAGVTVGAAIGRVAAGSRM